MEGGGKGGEGCIGWWKATHDEGMGLACVEVGTGGERGAQQHPGKGKNKHKKERTNTKRNFRGRTEDTQKGPEMARKVGKYRL